MLYGGFVLTLGTSYFTTTLDQELDLEKKGVSGKELYAALRQRGFLVRHFDKDRIRDFVRITIGSAEDMQAFCQAVAEILP